MVSLWQKKNLMTIIQVNFVLIPSEAGMRTQIDLNCCYYKLFAIDRPSQLFLGCHLNFTIFSPWPSFRVARLGSIFFLQLEWLFLSRYYQELNNRREIV